MEEAPENSKESSHSARANGMNELPHHALQEPEDVPHLSMHQHGLKIHFLPNTVTFSVLLYSCFVE
jgi:hypothetical protein